MARAKISQGITHTWRRDEKSKCKEGAKARSTQRPKGRPKSLLQSASFLVKSHTCQDDGQNTIGSAAWMMYSCWEHWDSPRILLHYYNDQINWSINHSRGPGEKPNKKNPKWAAWVTGWRQWTRREIDFPDLKDQATGQLWRLDRMTQASSERSCWVFNRPWGHFEGCAFWPCVLQKKFIFFLLAYLRNPTREKVLMFSTAARAWHCFNTTVL